MGNKKKAIGKYCANLTMKDKKKLESALRKRTNLLLSNKFVELWTTPPPFC